MLFNRFLFGPLMDGTAGDGATGGGAGDNSQHDDGAHNGSDGQDDGAPPPALSLESLLAGLKSSLPDIIKPLMATEINQAVGRIDRELKALKKAQAPPAAAFGDESATPRERELSERVNRMEEERKQEMAALQARELDAEIKAALSQLPFQDGTGRQVAFDYYKAKAVRNEEGDLVIDEKPLGSYINGHASQVFDKFMQRRENVGGSGNATNRGSAGSKGFGIENIKSGMSAEDDRLARIALLAAYRSRQ